jgi:putative transposase
VHYWAYVIMPEHMHLLVWPTAVDFKMAMFLLTVKQSVAKKARVHIQRNSPEYLERSNGSFHFWQDGPGYDRNLMNPFAIWADID